MAGARPEHGALEYVPKRYPTNGTGHRRPMVQVGDPEISTVYQGDDVQVRDAAPVVAQVRRVQVDPRYSS